MAHVYQADHNKIYRRKKYVQETETTCSSKTFTLAPLVWCVPFYVHTTTTTTTSLDDPATHVPEEQLSPKSIVPVFNDLPVSLTLFGGVLSGLKVSLFLLLIPRVPQTPCGGSGTG